MKYKFDALIIGSGIAGNSCALQMAKLGLKVLIITKKDRAESNTNYAQGGIASVTSKTDDFDSHLQDTLDAGDGLCDNKVARSIISDGPERIQALIDLGVTFTRLNNGELSLGKEGGHSKRRILHVEDLTGRAIESALLVAVNQSPNISVWEHHFAIELISTDKITSPPNTPKCVLGMYVLNNKTSQVETVISPAVMIATGGIGQVYLYTTNPLIATGDGIAIAYRAGAKIRNMEFIQFHPTTLYTDKSDRFLITEAVRGEGGILRNLKGEPFMAKYDSRKDLAPRDIVARAIDSEMKILGDPHVWLDITHRDKAFLKKRFPNIYDHCSKEGFDISNDLVPVVPACHYLSGGIQTDLKANTSIRGLYACGEVASTGLHGANRLASNSLLEAIVMANRGANSIREYLKSGVYTKFEIPDWVSGSVSHSDERVVLSHNRDELRRLMWDYVGIVRTNKRLTRALTRLQNLNKEINEYYWNFKVDIELLELRNMVQSAILIVECALQRKESRGLHFTLDFPDKLGELIDTKS